MIPDLCMIHKSGIFLNVQLKFTKLANQHTFTLKTASALDSQVQKYSTSLC